jgi:hypothetical protein
MFWRRKQKKVEDTLRAVTEIAGDQIAPGMGTLLLVVGGLAVAGATAYVVHKKHKNKKAAE